MNDKIIHLASHNPSRRVRACADCRFKMNGPYSRDSTFWRCGFSGLHCSTEIMAEDGCGPDKQFWVEAPPPRPGFWTRLGDAIIAWIDRMDRYEEEDSRE